MNLLDILDRDTMADAKAITRRFRPAEVFFAIIGLAVILQAFSCMIGDKQKYWQETGERYRAYRKTHMEPARHAEPAQPVKQE